MTAQDELLRQMLLGMGLGGSIGGFLGAPLIIWAVIEAARADKLLADAHAEFFRTLAGRYQ